MKTENSKAEDVLKPYQIRLIKRMLSILEVSTDAESQLKEQFYLQKWFDFNLDYVVQAKANGKHYKIIYSEFMNPTNSFEITI